MRLSNVFLAISATVLLSSGSASPAGTQATGVSTMESQNSVRSLEVGNHAGDCKRSLRGGKTVYDDDDDDNNNEEEEERYKVNRLFSTTKLDRMLGGDKEFLRYKQWKDAKVTPTKIYDLLNIERSNKYKNLYDRYWANYYSL
uniref:RxLR effector protein n=1 Tax=Phytophthora agathidicida TaxID=1642459 RepID=A0A7G4WI11_9STRA|nr:PaRXLR22 [Phytophthora agathidicida]